MDTGGDGLLSPSIWFLLKDEGDHCPTCHWVKGQMSAMIKVSQCWYRCEGTDLKNNPWKFHADPSSTYRVNGPGLFYHLYRSFSHENVAWSLTTVMWQPPWPVRGLCGSSPLMCMQSPAKTAALLTRIGDSPHSKMGGNRGSCSALGNSMDFKLSGIVLYKWSYP